jgi:hypothetical protein
MAKNTHNTQPRPCASCFEIQRITKPRPTTPKAMRAISINHPKIVSMVVNIRNTMQRRRHIHRNGNVTRAMLAPESDRRQEIVCLRLHREQASYLPQTEAAQ